MEKYSDDYLKAAHREAICNKDHMGKSKICGCFNCLTIFDPQLISTWMTEEKLSFQTNRTRETAFCPVCGIDSILGDASGYPIDKYFLLQMQIKYFNTEYQMALYKDKCGIASLKELNKARTKLGLPEENFFLG